MKIRPKRVQLPSLLSTLIVALSVTSGAINNAGAAINLNYSLDGNTILLEVRGFVNVTRTDECYPDYNQALVVDYVYDTYITGAYGFTTKAGDLGWQYSIPESHLTYDHKGSKWGPVSLNDIGTLVSSDMVYILVEITDGPDGAILCTNLGDYEYGRLNFGYVYAEYVYEYSSTAFDHFQELAAVIGDGHSVIGADSGTTYLTITASTVPEPSAFVYTSTAGLLLAGGIFISRRRKKNKAHKRGITGTQ